MTEQDLVTHLTTGAIVVNLVTAIRALMWVSKLHTGKVWICRGIGIECVSRVLMGVSVICFILVVLKTWSILDVFTTYWDSMNDTYHIRAFAYLGENYGVGMIGYAVVTMVKRMTMCRTADKLTNGKAKLVMMDDLKE